MLVLIVVTQESQPRVRRLHRRRLYLLIGAVLVVLAAAIASYILLNLESSPPPQPTITPTSKKTEPVKTIRFIATGDMLPHDSVNQNAKTAEGYNYRPFFAPVEPYLTSADMAYCNQEAPSDPAQSVSGYPTFNAPLAFARDLRAEGCNVINLANNHADDKGQSGIDATRTVWDGLQALGIAGTARSQAEQNQVTYFMVKGVKFAFLSYAQCSNNKAVSSYGLNILTQSLADQQIADARAQNVDMIIAGIHSCNENRSTEDAWQNQWAQYFADKGVNIVIGTGPHWLQPAKQIPRAGGGNTVVWFSLGNFLSTQLEVNGLIGGIAVMDIDIPTKSVTTMSFLPTYMHYEWTAAEKAADVQSARHNLALYPLDQAAAPLARSQNNTTVEAQTTRVTQLMNTYTPVTILTSKSFPR